MSRGNRSRNRLVGSVPRCRRGGYRLRREPRWSVNMCRTPARRRECAPAWRRSARHAQATSVYRSGCGNRSSFDRPSPRRRSRLQGASNWQFASPFVVGIEGDWSSFRAAGLGGAGPSSGFRRNTDWLASIRGRLGMVFDNTLFYATGGVGFERGGLNTFGTKSGHVPGRTISTSFTGGVDGGGIDWRYSPHVSFRLEGLHYFFNKSVTDNFSESKLIVDRLKDVSVVRAGAVFHFDSALFGKDKAPVVAPLLANTRS